MGGGVVFAIAAALWIAYLLPSWMRRREYLATERTAVRLQQTLRILAETAELPDEVRVEAKARAVAEHQKVLKKAERKALEETRAAAAAEARVRRVAEAHAARLENERLERLAADAAVADAAARLENEREVRLPGRPVSRPLDRPSETLAGGDAVPRPYVPVTVPDGAAEGTAAASTAAGRTVASARGAISNRDALALRMHRLRRSRAITTLTLLLGLVAAAAGAYSLMTDGDILLLASGAFVALASVALLVRLAGTGRRLVRGATLAARVVALADAPAALYDHAEHEPVAESEGAATWTPQPLPKPLHLSRGSAAAATMASIDAAAELRRAATVAAIERRAAELAQHPSPIPLRASAEATRADSVGEVRADSAGEAWGEADRADAAVVVADPAAQPSGRTAQGVSRFAAMGLIGDLDDHAMDLDAALRRRRAVG